MDDANVIKMGYKLDVVFCIDVTGSMYPCLDELKNKAKDFPKILREKFEKGGKSVAELRVKVIPFRDFASDGEDAIDDKTSFYDLFDEYALNQFVSKIDSLEPLGGGDAPESALEAVVCAMQSDWVKLSATDKGRHIIVVLTDAPPLKPGDRAGCDGMDVTKYPQDPDDFIDMYTGASQQFTSKMKGNARRLIVFGPEEGYTASDGEEYGWNTINDELGLAPINAACKMLYTPVKGADGLKGISFDAIIDDIYASAEAG